ncbi:tetratricopeptide repeat protein [bacterium]|nr:tetratricopeptide repeat protein [bacterium]
MICLIIFNSVLFAQDFNGLQEVFEETYELEYSGEYSKAIGLLKEVYNEESYEINLRLGWLTYLSGNFTEAIPYYQKSIQLKPLSIEARLGLVYPASSLGNWTQVETMYKEILKIDPQNSLVNYRMGLINYGHEDFNAAAQYFQKVINLYPFDYDGTIMMAWTNLKLEKQREARVLFQKALLISPGDESALEGLELLK